MNKATNIVVGACAVLGAGFWIVQSSEFSKLTASGPQLKVWVNNMPNVPQPMTVLHIQSKENRQLTLSSITADNKKLPLEGALCFSASGKPVLELGNECRLVISYFPNMTPVRVDVETTLGSSSYNFD